MGYVFDFKDALAYKKWFFSAKNKPAADFEARLIFEMLEPMGGRALLDIGCGIGARMAGFIDAGLDVTGVDPSCYMLDIASEKFKNRVELHRDFGESLPFEDNVFHYAVIIDTLEYVDDPEKVIEEACRVTREKIFIGIYNRYNLRLSRQRDKKFQPTEAGKNLRFFSIWEVLQMIRKVAGNVPVTWRTGCWLPGPLRRYENATIMTKMPFGAFAGIVFQPVPRFRTRPLSLKIKAKPSAVQGI